MQLIPRDKAAHWYAFDEGRVRPCYEVPKADGHGMRSTTIADARKLGLFWSVTRVLQTMAKPALEAWKQEQAILAALTLPRQEGEGTDAFARRVVEDMSSQSDTARSFGSKLHRQIEEELAGQKSLDIECADHLSCVREWLSKNCTGVHASEIIVAAPDLGVAGKLDLDCSLVEFGRSIVDFKTQRVKDGKPTFYDEWALQLAVYRHARASESELGLEDEAFQLLSVVIDSGPTPKIYAHWWPNEIDYLKLFVGILDWCCHTNNYDPRKQPRKDK